MFAKVYTLGVQFTAVATKNHSFFGICPLLRRSFLTRAKNHEDSYR